MPPPHPCRNSRLRRSIWAHSAHGVSAWYSSIDSYFFSKGKPCVTRKLCASKNLHILSHAPQLYVYYAKLSVLWKRKTSYSYKQNKRSKVHKLKRLRCIIHAIELWLYDQQKLNKAQHWGKEHGQNNDKRF